MFAHSLLLLGSAFSGGTCRYAYRQTIDACRQVRQKSKVKSRTSAGALHMLFNLETTTGKYVFREKKKSHC
jgi:hypothetical protein